MRLTDVYFSYNESGGEKDVLSGFSISLPDSGITAFAGESGCGKTTLLRLIGGLEAPRRGSIEAPKPSETAFMFQENRLLPELDCAGQLKAVLPKGAETAGYLEAVGLEREAHTLPSEMSGGMQRRLALARCLAYGSGKKLLILDEPFTGVDPPRILSIMNHIRQMGAAVIYSAHDAESLSLADLVVRFEGIPLREISREQRLNACIAE